ncbi:MAG: hypothetical protein CTY29_06285 [Methylobacter sp.]|nr:MAG: hypothetical protein CTY29_06285 [Methylobacter sp.]
MISFKGDLAITLTLKIAGQSYDIAASNIRSLELDLKQYGYSGKVSFEISPELATDELFTPFTTKSDLIEVSLTVEVFTVPTGSTSTPLQLSGLATARSMSEQTLTNILPTQDWMVARRYFLDFADPAQVLWKQHYPCDLFTNANLQSLIAAHTSEKIQLTYNWDVLQTVYPVLSLSLGAPGQSASFYDYIIWLVDSNNGVFSYDFGTNQYTFSAAKSDSGQAQSLDPLEVATIGIDFPEVRRDQPNVLNSYTEAAKISPITNDQKATPIRRDYIASYPIAADMQARVTLETARFKQRLHEVRLEFGTFQLQVTPPGQKVDFKGSSAWSSSLFNQPNTYRVRHWQFKAQWTEEGDDPGFNLFTGELAVRLEQDTELWVDLPEYNRPVYPVFVEGKVHSDKGTDTDASYQFYTDENTSVNYYQVNIPLWNDQLIRAAYQPNLDTGQFYFPPYKKSRVMIALEFNSAFIAYSLDWGVSTALPLDSQGNQVVMGKSATSRNIIKHAYVDSKPELQILRTEEKDTELLQFSDGYIILQTQQQKDEGS